MLRYLHNKGAYAEVVSGDEYDLAKKLKIPGDKIIFNGPVKTDKDIEQAIQDGCLINCDHSEEIYRIAAIAKQMGRTVKLGIRLIFSQISSWDRFGFTADDNGHSSAADAIVDYIQQQPQLSLTGIHCHIGTNIWELDLFKQMSQLAEQFCHKLLERYQIELEWLDLGGGLAGITPYRHQSEHSVLPQIKANDYMTAIITPWKKYLKQLSKAPLLIFEPGRTLYEPYGGLLTTVVDYRHGIAKDDLGGVLFDIGINHMPICYKYNFPFHIPNNQKLTKQRTMYFYGATCRQDDHLRQATEFPENAAGEPVIFYGVGSYAMAFSYSFIRYRPGVVAWFGDGEFRLIRRADNLEHASRLENF